MEIIGFINDLKKAGSIYYKIWLPIILQFDKSDSISIRLSIPLDVPKSTYHRVINYGITNFPNHVKAYCLARTRSQLILSINQTKHIKQTPEAVQKKEIEKETIQAEIVIQKPKLKRKKSNDSNYPDETYEDIINFLNQTSGKKYQANSKVNRKFITERLNDGFTVEDFKHVVLVKCSNWLGGEREMYLRPETLFGNKFEGYLNENVISNSPSSNLKKTYEQIDIASELLSSQE